MPSLFFCVLTLSHHNSKSHSFWNFPQIKNEGAYSALIEEIIHYNVRYSIFDIVVSFLCICLHIFLKKVVWSCKQAPSCLYPHNFSVLSLQMVAGVRFTLLLLMYALLHINHWWMVAVSVFFFFFCHAQSICDSFLQNLSLNIFPKLWLDQEIFWFHRNTLHVSIRLRINANIMNYFR